MKTSVVVVYRSVIHAHTKPTDEGEFGCRTISSITVGHRGSHRWSHRWVRRGTRSLSVDYLLRPLCHKLLLRSGLNVRERDREREWEREKRESKRTLLTSVFLLPCRIKTKKWPVSRFQQVSVQGLGWPAGQVLPRPHVSRPHVPYLHPRPWTVTWVQVSGHPRPWTVTFLRVIRPVIRNHI